MSEICNYDGDIAKKKHLVMLPCHAVYKGAGTGQDFADWHMENFQKEASDNLSWIKQIEQAIELIVGDPKQETIVIISGGKTKPVGAISELFSYLNLILQNQDHFLRKFTEGKGTKEAEDIRLKVINSVYLEEYARDSFENLLFSISRFRDITSIYPSNVTIVGYKFKENRFLNYHVPTLAFKNSKNPLSATTFQYIGIDPVPPYSKDSEEYDKFFSVLHQSEYRHALSLFAEDPLGGKGKLLAKKRNRNPFNSIAPYYLTNKYWFDLVLLHNRQYYEDLKIDQVLKGEPPIVWFC